MARQLSSCEEESLLSPHYVLCLRSSHLVLKVGLPPGNEVRGIRTENSTQEESLERSFAGEDLLYIDRTQTQITVSFE